MLGRPPRPCLIPRISRSYSWPPRLLHRKIADIREAHVRRWRHELLDTGTSPSSVAKAYRLLKANMNTAVDDGIIRRNPCRVRGASQDRSPERPVLTLREVVGLAEVIEDKYEALILLAVFGSLRWGELAALRRRDIDQAAGVAKIERSLTELPGRGYPLRPAKVRCRAAHRRDTDGDHADPEASPGELHRARARRLGVHQPYRGAVAPQ